MWHRFETSWRDDAKALEVLDPEHWRTLYAYAGSCDAYGLHVIGRRALDRATNGALTPQSVEEVAALVPHLLGVYEAEGIRCAVLVPQYSVARTDKHMRGKARAPKPPMDFWDTLNTRSSNMVGRARPTDQPTNHTNLPTNLPHPPSGGAGEVGCNGAASAPPADAGSPGADDDDRPDWWLMDLAHRHRTGQRVGEGEKPWIERALAFWAAAWAEGASDG